MDKDKLIFNQASEEEEGLKYRKVEGWAKYIVMVFTIIATGLSVFYIFRLSFYGMVFVETGYFLLLIAFLLPLEFILVPATRAASKRPTPSYDIVAAFLAFAIPFYLSTIAQTIMLRGWEVIAPSYIKLLCLSLLILAVRQ